MCQISSCKKFSFSCIKKKILGLNVKLKTLEIFFNCSEIPMFCKWWNVCGKNLQEQQKITFVSIQVNSLTQIHTVSKNVSVSLFTYSNGIQNIVIISGIAPLLHVYVCVSVHEIVNIKKYRFFFLNIARAKSNNECNERLRSQKIHLTHYNFILDVPIKYELILKVITLTRSISISFSMCHWNLFPNLVWIAINI